MINEEKNNKVLYREGILHFNPRNGRYALVGENLFTGYPIVLNHGFHCGDTMQVKLKSGRWKDTRIEMRDNGEWYLVDINTPETLNGICVRVEMIYITT